MTTTPLDPRPDTAQLNAPVGARRDGWPVSPIRQLERAIRDLTLTDPPEGTVSTYAATQVIDSHTLAVIVYSESNTDVIDRAIRNQDHTVQDITRVRDLITITI